MMRVLAQQDIAVGPVFLLVCVIIPFAILAVLAVGIVIGYFWRGRRDSLTMTCGKCGYSVKGLESMTCPECGADLREVGIKRGRHQA